MKIIISHDVDHITVWEHKKDLIVPKFIIRSSIELYLGKICIEEYFLRFKSLVTNKWQNLEKLMQFDKENVIPSTFFIGVSNGVGLRYSLQMAELWTKKIADKGFDVGVHGIAYNNFEKIKEEFEAFKRISSFEKFGIRMHYLRTDENTISFLEKVGYLFDSSIYELRNPFKIGNMWEFPLHIMDGHIFYINSRWQNQTLKQAKDRTKAIVEKAYKNGINYFTILFHDRYFSEEFKSWKEWYIWFITYLRDNRFQFIGYKDAMKELENNKNEKNMDNK